jgi:6-phosphofructokinase 1
LEKGWLRKIGVVTSGGDAPGMNAAIRAVVRIAYSKKLQVLGFRRGWEGLITNTFTALTPRSVGGIIQLGGTVLHTSRCPEFRKREGIRKAAKIAARASGVARGGSRIVVVCGDPSTPSGTTDLLRIQTM